MKTTVRGVRLPEPIWEALQREAANKGVTASELIREALRDYIELGPFSDRLAEAWDEGYEWGDPPHPVELEPNPYRTDHPGERVTESDLEEPLRFRVPLQFRAVREDGTVLVEWLSDPVSLMWHDLRGVEGQYEYQQKVGGEWVTLSRHQQ